MNHSHRLPAQTPSCLGFRPIPVVMGCFLAMALMVHGAARDPWITNLYQERVAITNLNPALAGTTLRDFPVLITLTNAGWLDNKLADGGDITFAGVDGQQLFHEMEQFDGATKSFTAWVCVPSFTNQTTIYMYWNNAGTQSFVGSNSTLTKAATYPTLATSDLASNAWDSNFVLVHHFASGSNAHRDSTRWANHSSTVDVNIRSNSNGMGFSKGVYSYPMQAKGGIKNTNFYANPTLSNLALQSITTTTCWFKWDIFPSNSAYLSSNIPAWVNQAPLFALQAQWSIPGSGDRGSLYYDLSNRLVASMNGVSGILSQGQVQDISGYKSDLGPSANWRFYGISGGKDATVGNKLFINCDDQWQSITGTYGTGLHVNAMYVLGTAGNSGSSYRWNPGGTMDEFRMSFVTRSSNWIMTEYSNMIQSTNMAVQNGICLDGVAYVSNLQVAIANATNLMIVGNALRGVHLGAGVTNTTVIFSNAGGGEAGRRTAIEDNARDWHVLLDLPVGSYVVSAISHDLSGNVAASASVAFNLVTSGSLTVKTIRPGGAPYGAGRIMGPSVVDRGVRTNDVNGVSVFSNLYSGVTYTLQNFALVPFGMSVVQTNFTMMAGDGTLTWVLADPTSTEVVTNGTASSVIDTAVFFPSSAAPLTLSVPLAKEGAVRATLTLIPLSGGRRTVLFDNLVGPGFPYIQVEPAVLKTLLSFGSYILEINIPSFSGDASRSVTTRKLLFVGR